MDKAFHRRGKNVEYSHVRMLFEVEDRDNDIPFEFHKESEVRIPFFRKDKSTCNDRSVSFVKTGICAYSPPRTNFSNKVDMVLYGP